MYYVYILTNKTKTVLYTGVTNNLVNRITEHYNNRGDKRTFTGRYSCFYLIFFEEFFNISNAISREKEIKNRPRSWKDELIRKENLQWVFLNALIFEVWPPV